MITLYPDQVEQIEGVRKSFAAGNKRVLMQAATGSGKTIMSTYILNAAVAKGNKCWFVCPRKELIKQTSMTLRQFRMNHGYIASGHREQPAPTHVVSLQTLSRRYDKLAPPDLAVIDEVHWGGNMIDTLVKWLRSNGTYIIGLSATPKLSNGSGMSKWFDDIVLGTSMKELIALGRLSGFKMYAPHVPDLSGIKITAGEYNQKDMSLFMDEHGKVMVGNAVKTYADNAHGKLGITFCTSIKESKRTADAYNEAGIPAAHIDGTMSADVRGALINAFADKKLLQICSVDLMTFGFDLAAQVGRDITVECMTDLAPTKSESKQLQKWGRVLRAKEEDALIFDHAGNAFEHGMPDAEREWKLEGDVRVRRSSSERAVPMRQCAECYFCHHPAPVCPNCGNVYPVKSRTVEEIEGELVEIKEIQKRKKKRMEVGKAKTLEDLKRIAKERNYKWGWVIKMARIKKIEI